LIVLDWINHIAPKSLDKSNLQIPLCFGMDMSW